MGMAALTGCDAAPPDPKTAASEIDRLRQTMSQYSGSDESPPIRVINQLLSLTDRLNETQVHMVARMTDDRLEDAVRQAARRGLERAAAEIVRERRWRHVAIAAAWSAMVLATGSYAGFQLGQATEGRQLARASSELQHAMRGTPEGARWLATVIASNDLAQPAHWCAAATHQATVAGGIVCYVPLWIKTPPAKPAS
jgi:hypothetical protein